MSVKKSGCKMDNLENYFTFISNDAANKNQPYSLLFFRTREMHFKITRNKHFYAIL